MIPNRDGKTALLEKYPLRDAMIEYYNASLENLLNEAVSDEGTSNEKSQTFKHKGQNVSVARATTLCAVSRHGDAVEVLYGTHAHAQLVGHKPATFNANAGVVPGGDR